MAPKCMVGAAQTCAVCHHARESNTRKSPTTVMLAWGIFAPRRGLKLGIIVVLQIKNTKTYNKKEDRDSLAVWAFCPQNGTQRGVHIDLLTPSPCTKEGLQPRLNVQSVASHPFHRLSHSKATVCCPLCYHCSSLWVALNGALA